MAEEKNIKTNGEDEKTKKINELGRKLKELREAQGITLEHASDATKIQKKYISAIEEGRLDELPKGPYCRSFLRQYCAFLTAPDMWAKYDPLTRGGNVTLEDFKASNEEPDMAVTPGVFRRSPRFWIYLLVVVSLAAAFWVTLRYRGEISTSATTPLEGGTAPIVREQQEKRAASADVSPDVVQPLSADASAPASVDLSWMDGKQPAPKPAQPAAASRSVSHRQATRSASRLLSMLSTLTGAPPPIFNPFIVTERALPIFISLRRRIFYRLERNSLKISLPVTSTISAISTMKPP